MIGIRLVRFVAAVELPILLAVAPALLFPTPRRLVVLAVLPVTWLCVWMVDGHLVPRTPMNASLWLLLAMTGVSVVVTFDVLFSLGKISGVVLGVLLCWSIARCLTTPYRLRIGMAWFLVVGAGFAAVGLLGANVSAKYPALAGAIAWLPLAIRGLPGAEEGFNPNPIAGCLILFVPVQVALLATGARRWLFPVYGAHWSDRLFVAIQAVLLLLTAGTVLLMQSRGAWMGLFMATVSFLVWHSRRTRLLATGAIGIVLLVVVALNHEQVFSLTSNRAEPVAVGTVAGRVAIWSGALYGIQDFPLTGMGMNAFRKIMPILYPAFVTTPNLDVAHAHNNLLQAALDLGIPGLVAYASIWMIAGALLITVYRCSGDRVYRAMAGGLGAGLIGHFIFGMADAIPLGSKMGVLFWLALGLTLALHRVALMHLPELGIASEISRRTESARGESPSPTDPQIDSIARRCTV